MDTARSKVTHIGVASVPESNISVRFALRPIFFELPEFPVADLELEFVFILQ